MAKEESEQTTSCLPLFEWDCQIVDPRQMHQVTAYVASAMRLGVAYAESRFVMPYVAYDLLEW